MVARAQVVEFEGERTSSNNCMMARLIQTCLEAREKMFLKYCESDILDQRREGWNCNSQRQAVEWGEGCGDDEVRLECWV